MRKLINGLAMGLLGGGIATPLYAQLEAVPPPAEIEAATAGDAAPAEAPASDAAAADASPGAAPADTVAKADEPVRSTSRLVEEVIVTAQKREENLQDVPISVQAFSSEALDARGIGDALNLPTVTPGLVYSVVAGYSIIYIRGVGTDAFVPSADASVATYIDGVYFPFSHGLVQSFGAVERVEVLKGPQGTLFGRNSTGGAINVITKKPGNTFEGSAQVSYGNFNDLQTRVYVNVPVTDTLAFSVSGLYDRSNSYYKLTDDSPLNGNYKLPISEEKGGRLRVKWAPLDDFDITVSALLVRKSGIEGVINQNTAPNPQYIPLGATTTPPYRSSVDYPPSDKSRNPVFYAEANYHFNWFDTKLLASHQGIKTGAGIDYDNTRAPLVAFFADQSARVNTQELQLISKDTTPGAEYFTWIGGVFHINSYAGFNDVLLSVGRDFPAFDNVVNILQTTLGPRIGGALDGLGSALDIEAEGFLRTESLAGYAQGTLKLPFDFAVTLGGRYQTETRELVGSRDQLQLTDAAAVPLFDFANQTTKDSNFSPKAVLDYHPVEEILLYASYSKGFKSGTYNILNIYTPTQYIKPETVTAYELGLKSQLFNHRLQFNGALFDTEIQNLQVQFVSLLSGGAVRFETAPHARIRGAEFDALWVVAPDTIPGLVATANGSYLHARYTDYPNASGFTDIGVPFGGKGFVLGGGVLPGRDFAGNTIVRSPKFSGTGGLSETFDALAGTFEVAADGYYNSGYFFSAQNTSTAKQKSYATLDARLSYFYSPWRLRLTAFGRNLTSTLYKVNDLATDIGTWTTYAPPRTYGARLNWDF